MQKQPGLNIIWENIGEMLCTFYKNHSMSLESHVPVIFTPVTNKKTQIR